MTALADTPPRRGSFLELLAVELAPREGRTLAVVQIATACAITVAVAMLFQIPEPTYMAYIVFLVSKDEKAATITTAVGGQLAVTLAILLTLGLMLVDLSEPALRLPAMALATFVAMYTARTFVLGPVTYLAGFVIVMLQSVVDDVPNPEALTRISLWLWIVLLVPIVVTLLLNLLFGPGARLVAERTVRKVLTDMESALPRGDVPPYLPHWQELTIALLSKKLSGGAAGAHPRITSDATRQLADVLVMLEVLPTAIPPEQLQALAARVRACRRALDNEDLESPLAALDSPSPAVMAVADALDQLRHKIKQPTDTPGAHAKHSPFAADALTNPAHWQFALKTTIAVMTVYCAYTLLDWPGLRTSIVTCFFVALGSLGETVHKLLLRVSGALIGGLIAGLCIVFVLPHLTDIGQLCTLIAVVSAGAAWVATSSERLAYGGMQIAFAFFLGILQGYAPATDLTVLRDRVAGILLGNVVMTIVFSTMWPESARVRLRAALAEVLREIGALLGGKQDPEAGRARVAQALVRADNFNMLSSFELHMLATTRSSPTGQTFLLNSIRRVAGASLVATSKPLLPLQSEASLGELGHWAQSAAQCTASSQTLPATPTLPGSSVQRATEELLLEMENAVTTAR
jgi:multidrug resistance protein MdtO